MITTNYMPTALYLSRIPGYNKLTIDNKKVIDAIEISY